MKDNPEVRVIIPAFNEQNAVALVIGEIPKSYISEIIVVDNGSSDATFAQAESHGATALLEPKKGYGQACLTGLRYIEEKRPSTDIIVFLDGDYSDYPEQLPDLIKPITSNEADLVIGSRNLGKREKGSMTIQQLFGNWLATSLIQLLYKVKFSDLGPFRAVRYDSLRKMQMSDTNYGWTVEMQLKAAKLNLRCKDIPVNYRKRIGISKVSGTVKGTIGAGYKILFTIFKYF